MRGRCKPEARAGRIYAYGLRSGLPEATQSPPPFPARKLNGRDVRGHAAAPEKVDHQKGDRRDRCTVLRKFRDRWAGDTQGSASYRRCGTATIGAACRDGTMADPQKLGVQAGHSPMISWGNWKWSARGRRTLTPYRRPRFRVMSSTRPGPKTKRGRAQEPQRRGMGGRSARITWWLFCVSSRVGQQVRRP
jgi:hypothetical protein